MKPNYAKNALNVVAIRRARYDALDAAHTLARRGLATLARDAERVAADCTTQIKTYRGMLSDPALYSDYPF